MKKNELEILEQYGFKASGLVYIKELVSHANSEATAKISITPWDDEWTMTIEFYFGGRYSGQSHYIYKSLKLCINRLAKDCDFFGFKKIA